MIEAGYSLDFYGLVYREMCFDSDMQMSQKAFNGAMRLVGDVVYKGSKSGDSFGELYHKKLKVTRKFTRTI